MWTHWVSQAVLVLLVSRGLANRSLHQSSTGSLNVYIGLQPGAGGVSMPHLQSTLVIWKRDAIYSTNCLAFLLKRVSRDVFLTWITSIKYIKEMLKMEWALKWLDETCMLASAGLEDWCSNYIFMPTIFRNQVPSSGKKKAWESINRDENVC